MTDNLKTWPKIAYVTPCENRTGKGFSQDGPLPDYVDCYGSFSTTYNGHIHQIEYIRADIVKQMCKESYERAIAFYGVPPLRGENVG